MSSNNNDGRRNVRPRISRQMQDVRDVVAESHRTITDTNSIAGDLRAADALIGQQVVPYNPQQVVSGNPPTAERQQFVPYNPQQVVPYNSVLSTAVSQPMNALPPHPNIAHYAGYAHGFPVPHLQSSLRNDACGFYPSLGYQAHFGFIPNPSQIANGIHQFGGYIGGAMLHQHPPQLATVVHNHEHVTYNVNAPSTINHNLIPGCSNPPDANDDIVYDDPASDCYESLSSMNFPEVMSDDIDERLEVTGVFKSVETKEDDQKTDEESANEPTQGDYLSDRLEIREEVHQDAEAFEEEEDLSSIRVMKTERMTKAAIGQEIPYSW
jgi:hypothetical protein